MQIKVKYIFWGHSVAHGNARSYRTALSLKMFELLLKFPQIADTAAKA
jgi:hypothetical protein